LLLFSLIDKGKGTKRVGEIQMKAAKNNKTLLIHADEQGLSQRLMPIHMYTKKHYKKNKKNFLMTISLM
jgi:hypothetical protein